MKNRKTAVLLGAAALTAALGLGYGLLTGAELHSYTFSLLISF